MENPYGPTRASVTPHYYHRQSPRSTASSQSNHTNHNHYNQQNLMISHHPQQYYLQLPVIVNNNGNGGGHLHNHFPQQKHHHIGEEAAAQLLGANSSSSSTQIIVVDPPRPPFIPKKPVISAASTTGGNGNGTNSPHHPHPPQQPVAAVAPIYSHHLQQQQQQMNNSPSSSPSFQLQKPPNPHHLQQQHIYAPPITSTTMTGMATTTTYIGANGSGNCTTMADSPQLDLEEGDYHVSHLSSGSRVTDEETAATEASSCFPVIEPEQQKQQETLHYNVPGNPSNGFGLNTSHSLGQNFSNSVGNSNNAVEKSTLKNHRRLSLINGIPSQQLQPFSGQRPPISSFGYSSEVGRLGEAGPGRIYATAGFSVTGLPMRRQAGMKSAGSQICLSQNVGTDGKATLSRKAQKLAQKAANTVGTLGSELSSSASALYSLFTSSSSAHEDCGQQNEGRATVVNGNGSVVYAESNGGKNGKNRGDLPPYSTSQQIYGNIWDKAPVVSAHTSRGIDFLERYGQFIKERAMIEEEYAAKMKNLVKKSRGKKSDDEEFRMYTTASAYQAMLNELESLASQHEVISERLRGELIPQLSEKCRHLRAGRKKHSQDFDAMEKGFQARVDELYKQKKNYEKAHMDAQNAHIKYVKAEKNMTLSRLDVEKAKQNSNTKSAICEQSKQSYAAQLATTNQAKFEHFNVLLPRLLEDMRRLDVDRIQFTKHAMLESVKVETGVLNIIQRCYSDMNTAIGTIDPDKDTHVVVEQTKTGFSHPVDFAFEDLGCPSAIVSDDTSSFDGSTMKRPASAKNGNGKGVARKQSMKLFSGTGGKTNGTGSGSQPSIASSGEYGTLPPQQRCRRIQQKLEELRKELKIKNDSFTGLEKMHNVYTNDRKMGDPMEVMKQLQQNRHEVNTLNEQIQRFENLLLHAQSELNQPLGGHHNNTTTNSTVGSSSPGSSPRGSAGSMLMNSSVGHKIPRTNGAGHGERGSSYSEASSISSADGATMHVNGAAGRQHVPQAPMPPNVVQQTSSTISTSGFSSTNATPVTSNHQQIQHIDADFYEECDGPVGGAVNGGPQHSDLILGTASAVYPYDAAPDEVGGTTISMKQGDDLLLLERDVGDGWTRVRHQKSGAEGFVPTSYLDCKWYPAH